MFVLLAVLLLLCRCVLVELVGCWLFWGGDGCLVDRKSVCCFGVRSSMCLCVCVLVCVCLRVCLRVCLFRLLFVWLSVRLSVCVFAYSVLYVFVC